MPQQEIPFRSEITGSIDTVRHDPVSQPQNRVRLFFGSVV
jgi:hypothetical protein